MTLGQPKEQEPGLWSTELRPAALETQRPAYRVPNLKLDLLVVDLNHSGAELHANRQIMQRLKPLISEL